ncbi:hypothetical protein [Amycolatopsis nigrescens]|nr:hypothetical protein [Amycolatopsis nigrescens]
MTANTATREITPLDYGIHVEFLTGYLRTAYGHPTAIAYYAGRS